MDAGDFVIGLIYATRIAAKHQQRVFLIQSAELTSKGRKDTWRTYTGESAALMEMKRFEDLTLEVALGYRVYPSGTFAWFQRGMMRRGFQSNNE